MILTDEQLVAQSIVNSIPEWRKQVTGRFSDLSGNRTVPMFSSVFRSKFNPRKVMPMATAVTAVPAVTTVSAPLLYRWSK
jgi:hypothetical protein